MNDAESSDAPLEALLEDYVNGRLDEPSLRALEIRLEADPEARRIFVRYTRMHSDLGVELRARQASERVLDAIADDLPEPTAIPPATFGRRDWFRRAGTVAAVAAALLLAAGVVWGLIGAWPRGGASDEAVAWLVNAQNCTWADGEQPGELRAGRALRVDRGLAELRFRCGARVVLEGPAHLELVSAASARLRHGRLTARVPAEAAGFEILSPQGKVIDLGTEFGMSVSETGATDVYVFEGLVEAHPAGRPGGGKVNLTRRQAARIADGQVIVRPAEPGRFVRAIVPATVAVPRTRKLEFGQAVDGTLCDATGRGTGLTHRLPGTGEGLRENDENLRLDLERGQLELTTTNSDLNTQYRLRRGEYLGLRLSELGFTGAEDFEVSAKYLAIPALEVVGQFGLYAGARSDRAIRGGLLGTRKEAGQYTQFLVNNPDGTDVDVYKVGLLETGTDLRVTLRRVAGTYTLTVEDLTAGGASTLTIRHPNFLDDEPDLYVGLFGANTQSEVRRTLVVKEFHATVWTTAPR